MEQALGLVPHKVAGAMDLCPHSARPGLVSGTASLARCPLLQSRSSTSCATRHLWEQQLQRHILLSVCVGTASSAKKVWTP